MKFNGSDFKVSITGTPNKPITGTRDLNISIAVATIDTSSRDSLGWKEVIGGQRSWTASVSGIVDYDEAANTAGVKSLVALEISRAAISLLFGNTATDSQTYAGNAIVTNVDTSAPYEGEVEWTMELEGSGPITLAEVA